MISVRPGIFPRCSECERGRQTDAEEEEQAENEVKTNSAVLFFEAETGAKVKTMTSAITTELESDWSKEGERETERKSGERVRVGGQRCN